jgi:hypothetical protein
VTVPPLTTVLLKCRREPDPQAAAGTALPAGDNSDRRIQLKADDVAAAANTTRMSPSPKKKPLLAPPPPPPLPPHCPQYHSFRGEEDPSAPIQTPDGVWHVFPINSNWGHCTSPNLLVWNCSHPSTGWNMSNTGGITVRSPPLVSLILGTLLRFRLHASLV